MQRNISAKATKKLVRLYGRIRQDRTKKRFRFDEDGFVLFQSRYKTECKYDLMVVSCMCWRVLRSDGWFYITIIFKKGVAARRVIMLVFGELVNALPPLAWRRYYTRNISRLCCRIVCFGFFIVLFVFLDGSAMEMWNIRKRTNTSTLSIVPLFSALSSATCFENLFSREPSSDTSCGKQKMELDDDSFFFDCSLFCCCRSTLDFK